MIPSTLPIVCLASGEFHGQADVYLRRLHSMLTRHCPVPFSLLCFSDRPREIQANMELRSCADWAELADPALHPTFAKLRFFDANTVPHDEFLFLDLSLVIRRDMTELLEFAFGQPQDLVLVDDWIYPCYNSSVMRIRRGAFQAIYDAFIEGKSYPRQLTDQDFIYAHIHAMGAQDRVTLFPENQIVSYKFLREVNYTDAAKAQQAINGATIVKFHGAPKMHIVADPIANFSQIRKFRLFGRGYRKGSFFARELRQLWRD